LDIYYKDKKPSIHLIEECDDKDALIREAIHITKQYMINENITNVSSVGDGTKKQSAKWRNNNKEMIDDIIHCLLDTVR